jgi:precorrin-8X/cobalt-precorrin-8 methylmutase
VEAALLPDPCGPERAPARGGAGAELPPARPDNPVPGVHPIEAESYRIIAGRVDLSGWGAGARDVVARIVHATADESFAGSTRIGESAVDAAVGALRRSAPVICDARMVLAGIPSVTGATCYLDRVPVAPAGSTRAAAAIDAAATDHPDGALWVIGNAPTALRRVLELYDTGLLRPAAVVGLPVGYVGAAEAKAALWGSALRPITLTNLGERGGSPAAAAAVNALARLARPAPAGRTRG